MSGNVGAQSPVRQQSQFKDLWKKLPRKAAASLWQVLGILLVMIGGVLFFISRSAKYGYLAGWGIGFLSFVCFSVGIGIFNRGRKYNAVNARQLFAQDKRHPVLYLRSFQDDTLAAQTYTAQSPLAWATEEEQIARVMNEIGPFVAIGNPREKLPELGAARTYQGDNEWQRTVSILSRHAELVVLRAGDTPGFWWEVQRVSKSVKPERLLFLIPDEKKEYERFRRTANQYFPKPLPEYAMPGKTTLSFPIQGYGALRGIVYFQKDWSSHFVSLKQPGLSVWNRRYPLYPILKIAMQPVFEQLNIPYDAPASKHLSLTAWAIIFVLFATCMMFILSGR